MKKLLAIIAIATLLASCTTTRHHACGITELNKQYSKGCGRQLWYLGGSIPPLSQLKQYKLNKINYYEKII